MECLKANRKECDLEGCYHHKKHKKDESCDGKDRCHFSEPCVTNHASFKGKNK